MDQIQDDTYQWTDIVLKTFSMYRDDWDRWDVHIETDGMYRWDLDVRDADDDHVRRISSLLRGSVGICTILEVILIVLLLYFLVPPMGDYIDINPWKNQCKPWGRLHKKKNKIQYYFIFPQDLHWICLGFTWVVTSACLVFTWVVTSA